MANKKSRVKTSASQITRAYAIVLVLVTLLMSVSIITVVGSFLAVSTKNNGTELMQSLKKSIINDKIDWDYWRETSAFNTHNTFVQITVSSEGKVKDRFYSKNTKDFLADNYRSWPIVKDIQYRNGQGLYYHIVDHDHFSEKKHEHRIQKYEIWLSLNRVVRLFLTIIGIIVAVCIVIFLIGLRSISKLAQKLNTPLQELTDATSQLVNSGELTHHEKLPVADNPKEVHDLTREFNHLLKIINDTALKDRQFVSDASHELRTPLAVIRGHVNLIRRRGTDHPELIPESLRFIDEESLRMQHLLESLLQLSRMDNAELDTQTFDLGAVARDVCAAYQSGISQSLVLAAAEPVMLTANQDSIQQIMVSLLSNAHKYSPRQSTITVKVTQTAQQVAFEVADQGNGVKDEEKQLIFNRFFRSDKSRSQKIEGTGLGLAIVTRLTELNHGQIKVLDNYPQGSRFIVTFERQSHSENL